MANTSLKQIAQRLVEDALQQGATGAEAIGRAGEEFSVGVRLGTVERLKEAASKSLGLRVFLGTRSASAFTSDLAPESLAKLLVRALEMARATSEDPASGLPEAALLGQYPGELALYSDDLSQLRTEQRIELARRAEAAAFQSDPRITNSEGSSFEASAGIKVYVNSHGFAGAYQSSYCTLSVVPVAQPNGGSAKAMERDYWYSVSRSMAALESPEAIGRKAAERVLRRLGARKVASCKVPVIFDPETAGALLGNIFEAVRGDMIYRRASFLAGKLGKKVAASHITILDDGVRPGGLGSRPFDDEGIPSSVTPVIAEGLLQNYLLNCYTARKLGLRTTGNAARGLAGAPSVGPKNFYLQAGPYPPEQIIGSVKEGLYLTELIGFGVNVVTGDYSRGAAGIWVENGELTYPVAEVTIAGNLAEILHGISMVGSDLEFRGAIASPTILVEGLTVAGT
jgi:PmbA protein